MMETVYRLMYKRMSRMTTFFFLSHTNIRLNMLYIMYTKLKLLSASMSRKSLVSSVHIYLAHTVKRGKHFVTALINLNLI